MASLWGPRPWRSTNVWDARRVIILYGKHLAGSQACNYRMTFCWGLYSTTPTEYCSCDVKIWKTKTPWGSLKFYYGFLKWGFSIYEKNKVCGKHKLKKLGRFSLERKLHRPVQNKFTFWSSYVNFFVLILKLLHLHECLVCACVQFTNVIFFSIFWKWIYCCDGKAEFSASLVQSSVSHDPSEITLICWCWKQWCCLIFKQWYFNNYLIFVFWKKKFVIM